MFFFPEPRYPTYVSHFQDFMWANAGAFLTGGLGLAAAYALMETPPMQIQRMIASQLVGLGLGTLVAAAAAFAVGKLLGMTSKKAALVTLLQLLAFFAIVLPRPAHAACTMADPCGLAQVAGEHRVLQQPTGYKQVYKSIYIVGKTADGKYNVYNIVGDLDDFNFKAGNLQYSDNDLIRLLPGVDKADVGKTLHCATICKTATGQVVGVHPSFKQVAKKK